MTIRQKYTQFSEKGPILCSLSPDGLHVVKRVGIADERAECPVLMSIARGGNVASAC